MIVNQVRRKFAIIIVILFSLCFLIMFFASITVSTLFTCQDIYQELYWLADNDPLGHDYNNMNDKYVFDTTYYGFNSVHYIALDNNHEIIAKYTIGNASDDILPANVEQDIINARGEEWKIKNYVFCKRNTDEGIIILATNYKSAEEHEMIRMQIVISILAIALITLISYYISSFAVAPMQQALLREKQFTADVSHSLKTPIASIKLNLDVLALEGANGLHMDNAKSQLDDLSNLVSELLTLSRADRLSRNEDISTFSLSNCAEKIALTYEGIAFSNNITTNYSIEKDIMMKGVQRDIENTLCILFENAIKYNKPEGTLNFSLKRIGSKADIIISDTGIGIAPNDLPHIFDRFYTVEASRDDNSNGLGLSIAQAVINNHHGSIAVSSTEGVGTAFRIQLHCLSKHTKF